MNTTRVHLVNRKGARDAKEGFGLFWTVRAQGVNEKGGGIDEHYQSTFGEPQGRKG